MKVFYGSDQEEHFLMAPRFLIPYGRIKNKNPIDMYIPAGKEWLLDSSGFTLSVKGESYEDQKDYDKFWSPEAYARFIDLWKPTWAFTQDFAFYSKKERHWTDEQIKDRHVKTNEKTAKIKDALNDKWRIANVVQGISKEDYHKHIDLMKESGTLTDFLGIGSVFRHPDFIEIISDIKKEIPGHIKLHALGVKKSHIKKHPALIYKLYSIDTTVWFSMGVYSAPIQLRNASLYLFIEDMENFIKNVEKKTYINEFEVEE